MMPTTRSASRSQSGSPPISRRARATASPSTARRAVATPAQRSASPAHRQSRQPSAASSHTESEAEPESETVRSPHRSRIAAQASPSTSRVPLPPSPVHPRRPTPRHPPPREAITIISSDEEDGDDDDEDYEPSSHGIAGTRTRALAARTDDDDDSFIIERVSRRPQQPIEIQDPQAASQPQLQLTPPRTQPPPLAYPLLNTFTCPICFCAPEDAVTTACGHVFCSECLFGAMKAASSTRVQENAWMAGMPRNPTWLRGRGGATRGGVARGSGRGGGGTGAAAGGRDAAGNANGAETASENDDDDDSAKVDPLFGPCPVCRTQLQGGFISGNTYTHGYEQRIKHHRPAFGLVFKIGKPIDDPRRQEPQSNVK